MRWVLGEQSAKALRGGKTEDVIFNGTQKRKRMGYCGGFPTYFENEDHALSVDYTEVMITRRVYRSGEGEYYINKSACRLKDIVELFRDTGVGKEGYSIIGQGRIDEILSKRARTGAAFLKRRRALSNTARARRRAKSAFPTCATTSPAWRISSPSWKASSSRWKRPAKPRGAT